MWKLCIKLSITRRKRWKFIIRENSRATDIPLQELPIKKGILVASINRKGKIIIPRGFDMMKKGDTVIVITQLAWAE